MRRHARRLARENGAVEKPVAQVASSAARHPLHQLQSAIGNRAVARLLAREADPSTPAATPKSKVEPGTDVPARPSEAVDQMKELHETAESEAGAMAGKCYRAFKLNVKEAGGYGDILDIYKDQRFKEHQLGALDFAEAVDEHGAEALGLKEVEGSPVGAEKGTILVLNGPKHGVSKEYGDISVISEVVGPNKNVLKCYNDGTLNLSTKDLTESVRAMYKPIARPEITAG